MVKIIFLIEQSFLNFKEIIPYYEKVTFIGMMGTGKSKFGRHIASVLKYNFYDLDHMIEKEFNMTIKEVIETNDIAGQKTCLSTLPAA